MRNLIRQFRAAWLFARYAPYIEEADAEDYWQPSDEQALAGFFSTYTGKKLQTRLNNFATKSAVSAVKQVKDHTYHSGWAAGTHAGIAAIYSHFPQATMVREPESEAMEIFETAEA
jgi:uncharacterized protein YqjF (DUF2071 family)